MSRTKADFLVFLLTTSLFAAPGPSDTGSGANLMTLQPRVQFDTTLGSFVIQLDAEKAPGTVLNFVRYVEDKYYEGTIFHRVISDFMIQGGAFTPDMKERVAGLREPIKNEWRNGLKNLGGTVAIARLGNQPDSARASFFINAVDNHNLDKPLDGAAYAVFGRVIDGMDTVDKIRHTPVRTDPKLNADRERPVVPVQPVVINSVRILDTLDRERTQQFAESFGAVVERSTTKDKAAEEQQIKERIKKIEAETQKKFVTSPSGLMSIDLVEGKGNTPAVQDMVLVHYVGSFADGTVFDDSRTNRDLGGGPAQLSPAKVVKGWMEALVTMKVGGKRIIVIPPELGFGEKGRREIPPNATLFYEMEVIGLE